VAPGERLSRLAAEAAGAPTPGAALRKLSELRVELEAFERRQVAHALAEGATFAAIARDLGLTRQAVHRRFRELASTQPPLLTAPDVRRIMRYAREEAAALGADELGGEHVLLAVLRAGDLPAAALLEGAGASLDRARTQVEAATTPRRKLFQRSPDAGDLRSLLAAPAREARARGSRRIEVEDVLLGALADFDGGASRTLRALGVDVDGLRAVIAAQLSGYPRAM
jgi:ATP-dependent Clp protease ATP-binding subunit ClpA